MVNSPADRVRRIEHWRDVTRPEDSATRVHWHDVNLLLAQLKQRDAILRKVFDPPDHGHYVDIEGGMIDTSGSYIDLTAGEVTLLRALLGAADG